MLRKYGRSNYHAKKVFVSNTVGGDGMHALWRNVYGFGSERQT